MSKLVAGTVVVSLGALGAASCARGPNVLLQPPGSGWWCFTKTGEYHNERASDRAVARLDEEGLRDSFHSGSSMCLRTKESCENLRGMAIADGEETGECARQDFASCVTYRSKKDAEEAYYCYALPSDCDFFRTKKLDEQKADYDYISACGQWGSAATAWSCFPTKADFDGTVVESSMCEGSPASCESLLKYVKDHPPERFKQETGTCAPAASVWCKPNERGGEVCAQLKTHCEMVEGTICTEKKSEPLQGQ